jgi:hypothetical protein
MGRRRPIHLVPGAIDLEMLFYIHVSDPYTVNVTKKNIPLILRSVRSGALNDRKGKNLKRKREVGKFHCFECYTKLRSFPYP